MSLGRGYITTSFTSAIPCSCSREICNHTIFFSRQIAPHVVSQSPYSHFATKEALGPWDSPTIKKIQFHKIFWRGTAQPDQRCNFLLIRQSYGRDEAKKVVMKKELL